MAWIGLRLLLTRADGAASLTHIDAHRSARQATFAISLNSKAIASCVAFLFIDPNVRLGMSSIAGMTATIAVITALYGLALRTFAQAVGKRLDAPRPATRWLRRIAGVLLIGFAWRLLRD